MKELFGTVRRKLLLCGLLSLLLANVTEAALGGAFYFVYCQLTQQKQEDVVQNQYLLNSRELPQESVKIAVNSLAVGSAPGTEEKKIPVFGVLAALLVQGGLFVGYFYLLTRPYIDYMKALSAEIKGFAKGNLQQKLEVHGTDEFATIARSLNEMADDINHMIEHDRQVEARKNELVTNVAHDLRTPLTSILGYLGLAKRQELPEEQREQYIETAYAKAKRLEKLIEDLFEYSKMSQGAVRMDVTELDLICVLRQLLEEFYPSFAESGLQLDFVCKDKTAYLTADGNLLARAFANLIGNAVKYGADGKRVEITLTQTEQEITVKVLNFGEIIPKEALGNIFDRFYRVESSRSTQTGGSGLGLTIAKSIMELHHGTIEAESNLEGTTFTVILPKKWEPEKEEV